MKYIDRHDAIGEDDYNQETKMYVDNDYLLNYKSFYGSTSLGINHAKKFRVSFINLNEIDSDKNDFKITISQD